jgi:hypothetical protein
VFALHDHPLEFGHAERVRERSIDRQVSASIGSPSLREQLSVRVSGCIDQKVEDQAFEPVIVEKRPLQSCGYLP